MRALLSGGPFGSLRVASHPSVEKKGKKWGYTRGGEGRSEGAVVRLSQQWD